MKSTTEPRRAQGGRTVSDLMSAAGVTREIIAVRTGVSCTTTFRAQRGDASVSRANRARLARACGVTLAVFDAALARSGKAARS